MIPVSSNQLAKKTVPMSTNSFSSKSTPKSSNTMTRKQVAIAYEVAWNGVNLSDGGLGDDLYSPSAFGVNEGGSFSHFQNLVQPEISHD